MPKPDANAVPTAEESWRYVLRFLAALVTSFAVVSVGLLGYGLYTRGQAREAEALLAGQPSPDAMKQAFGLLRSPHLFAGWRVPDAIFPADDPLLAKQDEEALARAVIALPEVPQPTDRAATDCKGDPACLVGVLGKPYKKGARPPERFKVYRYLLLRRAMARGEAIGAEELRFFRWNVTLWVRAFERQIVQGEGTATASDAEMLRGLEDSRQGATENGIVFATFGLAVTALLAGVLFAWWRYRRPEDVLAAKNL